jgi:hypothetical protein
MTTFERVMSHLVGLGALALSAFCFYVAFARWTVAAMATMSMPGVFFAYHALGYGQWLARQRKLTRVSDIFGATAVFLLAWLLWSGAAVVIVGFLLVVLVEIGSWVAGSIQVGETGVWMSAPNPLADLEDTAVWFALSVALGFYFACTRTAPSMVREKDSSGSHL